jgi:hypothetical protein
MVFSQLVHKTASRSGSSIGKAEASTAIILCGVSNLFSEREKRASVKTTRLSCTFPPECRDEIDFLYSALLAREKWLMKKLSDSQESIRD